MTDPGCEGPSASGRVRRRRRQPLSSPGLVDVARAAGVSTATASRALTRPELVSEAVRGRVLQAASRLAYIANAAGRSLSTHRAGRVGIVLGEAADPVILQMLESAERTLSARGVGALIRLAGQVPAVECARSLAALGVDGMMFVGLDPLIGGSGTTAGTSVPCVGCDLRPGRDAAAGAAETIELRGVELALRYLRQLGHRRIGAISRARAGEIGARNGALEDIAVIDRQVDVLQDPDAVRSAVRALLDEEVTAIVAGSDAAAAAALRECRALDLLVPRAVSVIGWGDTGLARCSEPLLTSVRMPAQAMGEAAAERLLALMTNGPFQWPDLSPRLVIRESAGPAPA